MVKSTYSWRMDSYSIIYILYVIEVVVMVVHESLVCSEQLNGPLFFRKICSADFSVFQQLLYIWFWTLSDRDRMKRWISKSYWGQLMDSYIYVCVCVCVCVCVYIHTLGILCMSHDYFYDHFNLMDLFFMVLTAPVPFCYDKWKKS